MQLTDVKELGDQARAEIGRATMGLREAKEAALVAMIGRYGIALVGLTGSGKNALARSVFAIIEDCGPVIELPVDAMMTNPGRIPRAAHVVYLYHANRVGPDGLDALVRQLDVDRTGALRTTESASVRLLVSTMTPDRAATYTFPLSAEVVDVHTIAVEIDERRSRGGLSEAATAAWETAGQARPEPEDLSPVCTWADLDAARSTALGEVVLHPDAVEALTHYGSDPRLEDQSRFLAALDGRGSVERADVEKAARWTSHARQLAGMRRTDLAQ